MHLLNCILNLSPPLHLNAHAFFSLVFQSMIFVFEVAYRPDGPGVRFFIRSNIIIFASQGFLIRTASQKNPRSGGDQKPLASEDGILYKKRSGLSL